jgi:N-methylhydantoinase A
MFRVPWRARGPQNPRPAPGRPPRPAGGAIKGSRRAYFLETGGFVSTTVYDRYRLPVGEALAGPAVVEEDGSTLVVGPGALAIVSPSGNLIISLPVPDRS